MTNTELYERDFVGWSALTAEAIRNGRWSDIDQLVLAEEIESMGRSDAREVSSRLVVLVAHLVKWQFQPDKRSPSWQITINIQRNDVAGLLEESPSLRRKLNLPKVYRKAVDLAVYEMIYPDKRGLPRQCPWTLEQILDEKFWPGDKT